MWAHTAKGPAGKFGDVLAVGPADPNDTELFLQVGGGRGASFIWGMGGVHVWGSQVAWLVWKNGERQQPCTPWNGFGGDGTAAIVGTEDEAKRVAPPTYLCMRPAAAYTAHHRAAVTVLPTHTHALPLSNASPRPNHNGPLPATPTPTHGHTYPHPTSIPQSTSCVQVISWDSINKVFNYYQIQRPMEGALLV